jgi:hypothetical protein
MDQHGRLVAFAPDYCGGSATCRICEPLGLGGEAMTLEQRQSISFEGGNPIDGANIHQLKLVNQPRRRLKSTLSVVRFKF